MTCRWHSNCFMQLIEREWIMGVQGPAVLCRALQHHWGWQRALLQLGNDPYLNCSKTRLIATRATHWADHVINWYERRNIPLSWGVHMNVLWVWLDKHFALLCPLLYNLYSNILTVNARTVAFILDPVGRKYLHKPFSAINGPKCLINQT